MKYLATLKSSGFTLFGLLVVLFVFLTQAGFAGIKEDFENYRVLLLAPLREGESEAAKLIRKGSFVTNESGVKFYKNDIIHTSRSIKISTHEERMLVFGYLWDKDLHLRCVAYLTLVGCADGNVPSADLEKIGSKEFSEKVYYAAWRMRDDKDK